MLDVGVPLETVGKLHALAGGQLFNSVLEDALAAHLFPEVGFDL